MGLIIPGFVPSTLHEWVEYLPSMVEWKVTAGIWAGGLIIYVALKGRDSHLHGAGRVENPAAT